MTKPVKLSNFVGADNQDIEEHARTVDKDLKNIITYLSVFPRFFTAVAEPTLNTNEFGFWLDSGTSKYYLIMNLNGTQKKVELT